jgi:hypothetical protein
MLLLSAARRSWSDPTGNPKGDFKSATARMTLLHISYASWHDLVRRGQNRLMTALHTATLRVQPLE